MEPVKVGRFTVSLEPDEDPMSPRDADNIGILCLFARSYNLPREADYDPKNYSGWEAMERDIKKKEKPVVILPVYMYDHSGVWLSTTLKYPFNDKWDGGQIGFIWTTKARMEKLGVTKPTKAKVHQYLVDEVDSYGKYLNGDYVGFVVRNERGEVEESVWGFDDPKYAMSEGVASAKHMQASEEERKKSGIVEGIVKRQAGMKKQNPRKATMKDVEDAIKEFNLSTGGSLLELRGHLEDGSMNLETESGLVLAQMKKGGSPAVLFKAVVGQIEELERSVPEENPRTVPTRQEMMAKSVGYVRNDPQGHQRQRLWFHGKNMEALVHLHYEERRGYSLIEVWTAKWIGGDGGDWSPMKKTLEIQPLAQRTKVEEYEKDDDEWVNEVVRHLERIGFDPYEVKFMLQARFGQPEDAEHWSKDKVGPAAFNRWKAGENTFYKDYGHHSWERSAKKNPFGPDSEYWHFRVADPTLFRKGSFRTKSVPGTNDNLKWVFGKKPGKKKMEVQKYLVLKSSVRDEKDAEKMVRHYINRGNIRHA